MEKCLILGTISKYFFEQFVNNTGLAEKMYTQGDLINIKVKPIEFCWQSSKSKVFKFQPMFIQQSSVILT